MINPNALLLTDFEQCLSLAEYPIKSIILTDAHRLHEELSMNPKNQTVHAEKEWLDFVSFILEKYADIMTYIEQ